MPPRPLSPNLLSSNLLNSRPLSSRLLDSRPLGARASLPSGLRLLLGLALLLGVAAPTLAQERGDQLSVQGPEASVQAIAQAWADLIQARLVIDPQVTNVRLKVQPGVSWWSRAEAAEALRFHDVIVVERGPVLQFVHARNLSSKCAPPFPVYRPEDLLPANEVLTVIVKIRHGAASSIFANLRGVMSRDPTRVGNLLYVAEESQLIVTDLGAKVRYYLDLIERLDVAPRRVPAALEVYELPVERYEELRRGAIAEVGSRLALAAAQEPAVRRVSRTRVALHAGAQVSRRVGDQLVSLRCWSHKVTLSLGPARPVTAGVPRGEGEEPMPTAVLSEPRETLRSVFLASDPRAGRVRVVVLGRE